MEELEADGVDTALVLRQAGAPSPFTYIIVDSEGGLAPDCCLRRRRITPLQAQFSSAVNMHMLISMQAPHDRTYQPMAAMSSSTAHQ